MLFEKLNGMVKHYSVNHVGIKRALKVNHIQGRGAALKTTPSDMQRIKAICEQGADVGRVRSIMLHIRMLNSVLQVLKNSFLSLAHAQMDALLIGLTHSVTMRLEMLGGQRFLSRQETAFQKVTGQI